MPMTTTKPPARALPLILALLVLSACATDPSREETRQGSPGPTVYGQLGVSIDHVSRD
jgi:hypothetical protein